MSFAMQLACINRNNYFSRSIKKYVVECINKKLYYVVDKRTYYMHSLSI